MALDKIKLANKKARREASRRRVRANIKMTKERHALRAARARKIMEQGHREFLQSKRGELDYVASLEQEILDE